MKKILLAAALAACATMACAKPSKGESIELKNARKTVLNVTVDGQPLKVTWYADNYVRYPNRPEDQLINIYVPENATKASPILFHVNNGGWQANSYPTNTVMDGKEYDGTNDKTGAALREGFVVVSYGCRSRANAPVDGKYLGHSPATMTDTKAAIRYLRHNRKALPAGNTDRIIITGTSGGGALSTVIAASGNSPDYYPSLYEIGAAGVTRLKDGTYVSDPASGDEVFAVIGYCPITDLEHSCAGYEWLFGHTREVMYLTGEMNYSQADEKTILAGSRELAAMYGPYVDGLGLKDEQGNSINSGNLRSYIEKLMREEIEKTLAEVGPEQMKKDIEAEIRQRGRGGRMGGAGDARQGSAAAAPVQHRVNNGWLTFHEDGTYDYDLEKHLYYLAKYTTLKVVSAFSNRGLYGGGGQNEDTLFGTPDQEYTPFTQYSWNHDAARNGGGLDETGMTWDRFVQTEAGKELLLQAKMACTIDYLVEGKADTAPYWYVRHGMDDRDNSFAVETTLFYAVKGNAKVRDANVGFAWLKPHSGDYDIPEAFAWLKDVLSQADRTP